MITKCGESQTLGGPLLSDKAVEAVCLGGVGAQSGGRNQTETLSFSASPTSSHWSKGLAAIGREENKAKR